MALKLDAQDLKSYLSLICEYELYILPKRKVSTANDHSENYMMNRPTLVCHLMRNRLFQQRASGCFIGVCVIHLSNHRLMQSGVSPISHNALDQIICTIFPPYYQVIQSCSQLWKVTTMMTYSTCT